MPIEEKINWILRKNQLHSKEFIDQQPRRRYYRSLHPTEIAAFKCMDGRIHIPIVTNTPLGIIQPYRNLAGKFDMGWPYLGESVTAWCDYSISRGRKCLALVTYHFSAGDNACRGCAGFHYDKEEAFNFTIDFKGQLESVFGKNNGIFFPIIVGLETDTDALIFHGENFNEILDVSKLPVDSSSEDLLLRISKIYPNFPEKIRADILPLVAGNIKHVENVRKSNRQILDSEHREWILGIGRGFDWLHDPNTALIIGPYSPDLSEPIEIAAKIIKDNMESNRISRNGFVLLTSAIYREVGVDQKRAIAKTRFLKKFSEYIITKKFPELKDVMVPLSVVVDLNTREMKRID